MTRDRLLGAALALYLVSADQFLGWLTAADDKRGFAEGVMYGMFAVVCHFESRRRGGIMWRGRSREGK